MKHANVTKAISPCVSPEELPPVLSSGVFDVLAELLLLVKADADDISFKLTIDRTEALSPLPGLFLQTITVGGKYGSVKENE